MNKPKRGEVFTIIDHKSPLCGQLVTYSHEDFSVLRNEDFPYAFEDENNQILMGRLDQVEKL